MELLKEKIEDLGYDLSGMDSLVYMDEFSIWKDNCTGGQCTKGCTDGCAPGSLIKG